MRFYKYHGAGNDFLLADARGKGGALLSEGTVKRLCDRHLGIGADGLMLLEDSSLADFAMRYYNPDGSSGMMCGNGGRCIVAFAADLSVPASGEGRYRFEATDGLHEADFTAPDGNVRTVSLSMSVKGQVIEIEKDTFFVDTGARHCVRLVENVDDVDVAQVGKALRNDPRFAPAGANVNFVQICDGFLRIRTFEKGVEAETLACGTGITAAALVASYLGIPLSVQQCGSGYKVRAAVAELEVLLGSDGSSAVLRGPAERVAEIEFY